MNIIPRTRRKDRKPIASIEADGVLLAVAMGTALVSLAISAATVWALLGAAFWVWG